MTCYTRYPSDSSGSIERNYRLLDHQNEGRILLSGEPIYKLLGFLSNKKLFYTIIKTGLLAK